MERRGVAFGDTLMDLRASFPVARWAGARAGDPNAPVRLRLRMNSFFLDGRGQALASPPADFTTDSTLVSFLIPANAPGSVSYLLSRVQHPYPWVAAFLETEISRFAFQAAQVARRVGSHGFDLFADVYDYFRPLVLQQSWYLGDVLAPVPYPEEELGLGGVRGRQVLPIASRGDAERIDGVLVISPVEELLVTHGGEMGSDAEVVDGVLILSPEQEVLITDRGEMGSDTAEEMDGVLILSLEEELFVAGGGAEMHRDPASSPEIKSLKTVQYSKDGGFGQEACPICCDDFEAETELVVMPLCFHAFHAHCLLRWLQESRVCPLCRTKIAAE